MLAARDVSRTLTTLRQYRAVHRQAANWKGPVRNTSRAHSVFSDGLRNLRHTARLRKSGEKRDQAADDLGGMVKKTTAGLLVPLSCTHRQRPGAAIAIRRFTSCLCETHFWMRCISKGRRVASPMCCFTGPFPRWSLECSVRGTPATAKARRVSIGPLCHSILDQKWAVQISFASAKTWNFFFNGANWPSSVTKTSGSGGQSNAARRFTTSCCLPRR